MTVHRAATIISAIIATIVAFAVPIAQLQTSRVVTTCCCPDPSHCHCPAEPTTPEPTCRACHHERHDTVAPVAPAFAIASIQTETPIVRSIASPVVTPSSPHASPDLRRPSAPS